MVPASTRGGGTSKSAWSKGRAASGHRRCDTAALDRVIFVTRLRLTDMPIAEIWRSPRTAPEPLRARTDLLVHHRETLVHKMQELDFAVAALDQKLAIYVSQRDPNTTQYTFDRSDRD